MENKMTEKRLARLEQNARDLWFGLLLLFGFIPVLAGTMTENTSLIFVGAVIILVVCAVRIVNWLRRN